MSIALSQEVCEGVEFDFTPSYPGSATDFVLVNNPDGVSIETDGRIALSDTVVFGDYYLIINYTIGEGGPAGQMIVYLSVKECEERLYKTSYTICKSGSQTIKLAGSGTLGTPDFGEHSIEVTETSDNVFSIDTSSMTLNQVYEIAITVDGVSKSFTLKAINCTTSSLLSVADCENEPLQVIWKNRAGGWNNYWLMQDKGYSVDQEEGKTYINLNDEKKWTSRGNIYDVVEINNQLVPKSHVDLVRSLKDSIQAYIGTDLNDPLTFVPIILDEESFSLYKTGEEFYSFSFNFKYAKKRKVQLQ
jgi:hypothetical protein